MGLLKAVVAFLIAATAFIRVVYPVAVSRKIIKDIEAYEDEIIRLATIGDAVSKLRAERISIRKRRASEQLSSLRPSDGDDGAGI
jgi:hypothetical protein